MASHDHHDDVFREFGKQFDIDAKAHAHDEPKLGGEVPAGVKNGIAQITSVKIDRYKTGTMQGKPYGQISARVVFPDQAPDGTPILDMPVRFGPYPLCDTGSGDRFVSAADNLGEFQMALKALLGKSATAEAVGSAKAMQTTIAYLNEKVDAHGNPRKFYTRFRSWAFGKETIEQLPNGKWAVHVDGKPSTRTTTQYPTEQAGKTANPYAGREPRVNYDLLGRVEWQEAATPAGSGVRVASPPPPANPPLGDDIDGPTESAKIAQRIVSPPPAVPAAPPKGPGRPRKVATAPTPEPEPDVNELAATASDTANADAARVAAAKLTDLAKAAGVPEDTEGNLISEDASWQDVADRIIHIKAGGNPDGTEAGSAGGGDDAAAGVEVGNLYIYTTTTAQGKPVEKEVEVLALHDDGATAEVKDTQTGKPLLDPKTKTKLRVPVASLSPVPM